MKKRNEKRNSNWQIFFAIMLIFIIAVLVFFFQKKQIIPSPPTPGTPPTMHQFYGNVSLANGSLISNANVYALVNGVVEKNVTAVNGKYGYNPSFIIENVPDNSVIDFYVDNVKAASQTFTNLELTELNLVYSTCGDGYCSSQESCSSCPADCGNCPSPPPGGGSGPSGGSGSVPSTPIKPNITPPSVPSTPSTTQETPGQEANNATPETTKEVPKKAFNFMIVIIIIVAILLVSLISYFILSRRKSKSNLASLKEKIKNK
jgi:hypothetical protein